MKKVSILLAVFNGEQFIEEAIDSVLTQTYNDLELIVADDGSIDSTITILSKYKKYPKIKVLSLKHLGKVNAYNEAFRVADSTSSICLFAHDDILLPNSIEERAQALAKGALVAYQDFYICNKELEIINQNYCNYKKLTWAKDAQNFSRVNLVPGGSIILSRTVADKVFPIPNDLLFEDWWISFLALYYAGEIDFINKPLLKYRIHGFNDCGGFDTGQNYQTRILKDWKRHASLYCHLERRLKSESRKGNIGEKNKAPVIRALRNNRILVENTVTNRFTFPSLCLIKDVGVKKYLLSQSLLTPFAFQIKTFWKRIKRIFHR